MLRVLLLCCVRTLSHFSTCVNRRRAAAQWPRPTLTPQPPPPPQPAALRPLLLLLLQVAADCFPICRRTIRWRHRTTCRRTPRPNLHRRAGAVTTHCRRMARCHSTLRLTCCRATRQRPLRRRSPTTRHRRLRLHLRLRQPLHRPRLHLQRASTRMSSTSPSTRPPAPRPRPPPPPAKSPKPKTMTT